MELIQKAIQSCNYCTNTEFNIFTIKEGVNPDIYKCIQCGKEIDND